MGSRKREAKNPSPIRASVFCISLETTSVVKPPDGGWWQEQLETLTLNCRQANRR
jgi:hypothetical protein